MMLDFHHKISYNDKKRSKSIKIKFEVDINPPTGAKYELKYKLLPSPHQVRLYGAASLFAGKIHAKWVIES